MFSTLHTDFASAHAAHHRDSTRVGAARRHPLRALLARIAADAPAAPSTSATVRLAG